MKENKNGITELIESVTDEVLKLSRSSSVIGEPIKTEWGATVIPLNDLSIGFAGGSADKKDVKKSKANPAGAGGKVEIKPKAVIVFDGDKISVKNIQNYSLSLGDVLDTAKGLLPKKKSK